ncbi:putative nucleotidyltransferase, ribonuclease H [Tanacetum coccineum]|uniref:Nucleotidyltransferase, ribonuclease H n=1 Tax=Tanacetum coccineum TaxID=301880 RepID=A0ABQ4WPU3_9ASTR
MVTDLEDPKPHTVGGVWSGEYMDHGFTKSMKELDSCYTMLQELRSVIIGGALIHKNHEGSKHKGRRIRPTIGDFEGNCASNQSPFNNGRIEEWEEEKKEDQVSTTKIFHSKILINNSVYLGDVRLMASMMLNEFYLFSWEGRRIAMVPPKVTPQLPKHEVEVEEKIVKAEVVEDHIDKISSLLFKATNNWEYGGRVKKHEGFRVDVKRKSIEDKVRREKVFEVHEALNIENSRASSFQEREIHVDKTKVNAVRDWSSPKTLSEVRNIKVVDAFQKEEELEYVEPLDGESKQVTYVIQRTLCSPKVSDSSQRNKIFQTKWLVKEKISSIIIDGGSCKNLVSKALVKAFKLPTEPHPSPYQIWWIKKVPTLKVIKTCKVLIAIGKHYNELVTCDVVDIEACHVLLGRPWKHDTDDTLQGKSNMYMFKWSGKNSQLENKTLVTLVASPKEIQVERKETRVSCALVVKGIEDVIENAILAVIKPLIAEFGKIVTDDTLDALLTFRDIQHQIDLSRKNTLLVSISNEVAGFDSIKQLYASDEDFGNILMELKTKQHRGEFLLLDGYLFKGNRLCIPKTSLRSQLIKEVHARGLSAHLGRDKTIASVESQFYWPQLKRDVGAFVKRCVVCQEGKDCDDGSRPEEQHLVVACSDEEIVKFPTQPATTKISGDNGSNLEDFLIVLTREEADIIGPIMAVEDESLMMLGSGPNIIKKEFSNDLDGQHSTDESKPYHNTLRWKIMRYQLCIPYRVKSDNARMQELESHYAILVMIEALKRQIFALLDTDVSSI